MRISVFLMLASFVAWLGFVTGMMIRGVDPTVAGGGAFFVLALPLLVLPVFNFSPAIQINLVMAPKSKYLVLAMFLGSIALLSLWAAGSVDISYVVVFCSIWVQLLMLRFLVRRHFRVTGMYPGDVVFSPYGFGTSENMTLSWKNRLYAGALYLLGMAQFMLLVLVL